MKKINFKQPLKDFFNNEVQIKKHDGTMVQAYVHEDVVNILSHPKATPENLHLTQMQILNRMKLSLKIAEGNETDYDDDELSIIRESTTLLYNEKIITLAQASRILSLIETT